MSMSTRKIISIDREKCTGCGLCIPNCPEGALKVIDGKARLVSDLFCDGLGACLGHCPEGAISVSVREAVPYDEKRVMENIVPQGDNTILAHLEHLEVHGETRLLSQAVAYLRERGLEVPEGYEETGAPEKTPAGGLRAAPMHASDAAGRPEPRHAHGASGCPGSRAVDLSPGAKPGAVEAPRGPSALANWPVQLHLVSPTSPLFQGRDVLLAADCTAFASGSFHGTWLSGRALAIACPKLDEGMEIYKEKITAMMDHAQIATLTVLMMEVPCCRGLLAIAEKAREAAHRKVPIKAVVLGIQGGGVLSEEWV